MTYDPDNGAPEAYRDLVRRRHRKQQMWRRLLGLGVFVLVALAAMVFWISQVMISPPRPQVADSTRPVIGVVLHDDTDGADIAIAVPPASTAGLRPGDRVVSVDDMAVHSAAELRATIDASVAGEILRIEARRGQPAGAVLVDVIVEVRAVSPADFGLEFQEVAFTNPWDLTVRGWYVPPPARAIPAPGIAFGHGNAADRRHWLDAAVQFHRAGFGLLLLDFSGRGESQGDVITLGAREAGDLRAALEFLSGRSEIDDSRLFLAGRSMGAAAAVLAAAEGAPVRALVLDSPYADLGRLADEAIARTLPPAVFLRPLAFALTGWRTGFDPSSVRPLESMRQIRVPVLIVHGTDDDVVPIEHSRDLIDAAAGPARLLELPGRGHNDPRDAATISAMVEFLRSS